MIPTRALPRALLALIAAAITACSAGDAYRPPASLAPRTSASGPCSDFERDVERVWSATRKAEVSAAFVKLGVDYADRVVERVTTKMDDLTANWVMLSERLCKDYLVRKLLSKQEYTARSACFDSALIRQRTFARMLTTPNKGYAAHALSAFEEISDKLEECQNRAAWAPYAREAERPGAPGALPRLEHEVEGLASEAVLAVRFGDPERAERAAQQAVALAGTSGSERALLDSLLASARVDVQRARFASAGHKLEQAVAQAGALGAQLALALAYQYQGQLHHEQDRDREAAAAFARALDLRRALLQPDDPQIAWTLDNLGAAFHALGDDRRAIALHEEALALYRQRSDAREASISDALSNLGLAWAGLGEHERAIGYYERALAVDEPSARDDRPAIADTFQNLGLSYRERSDFARAQAAFERAIAIYRAAYGAGRPLHPRLLHALYGLGSTYLRAAEYTSAAPLLQQCVDALDPLDPLLAAARNDLGFALGELGQHERALLEFEQVVALRTRAAGTAPSELGDSHANLGIALARAGHDGRAVEPLARALALYRDALGERDPRVLHMLQQLGAVYRRLGDCPRARDALQQAQTIATSVLGPGAPQARQLRAELAAVCTNGQR